MKRTTIKDIAKELNINPSTVSRALNNHPDVSQSLRSAVHELAEKMGYRPNLMAVNLKRGRNKTIAVIIPEMTMFFFPSVMRAIEEIAHSRGYHLMVLHSNEMAEREVQSADICAYMGVEGVLVSVTKETTSFQHFQQLWERDIPVVFFDKIIEDAPAHKVAFHGEMAGKIAAEELADGLPPNARICGIFGDPRMSITHDRVKGFTKALANIGRPINIADIHFATNFDLAAQAFIVMCKEAPSPDALFVMTDEILAGVSFAAKKIKIDLGKDLKIVAVSDGKLPRILPYSIPFVETSGYDLGLTAAYRLFDLIDGKVLPPSTFYLKTPLVKE